jgi:hypothetical protein
MEDRKHPSGTAKSEAKQTPDEVDIASDRMGDNRLQGDDQSNVRNQRQAVPDVKDEADGVIESFQKMDKDARARMGLGKSERTED